MDSIATRISALIAERRISYGELEKATGIPKSALQRYATGETAKVPIERVQAIAAALNVSTGFLLGLHAADPSVLLDGANDKIEERREYYRSHPKQKAFFSLTDKATPQDMDAAYEIAIAYLKGRGYTADE